MSCGLFCSGGLTPTRFAAQTDFPLPGGGKKMMRALFLGVSALSDIRHIGEIMIDFFSVQKAIAQPDEQRLQFLQPVRIKLNL